MTWSGSGSGFSSESVSVPSGGICIAQSLKIPHDHKPSDFDKIIRLLLDTRSARAVVLFASDEDIR